MLKIKGQTTTTPSILKYCYLKLICFQKLHLGREKEGRGKYLQCPSTSLDTYEKLFLRITEKCRGALQTYFFFSFLPQQLRDSYSLHTRYGYQLTATDQMIPPSSPQECDYERAKITMSASVIKMSGAADDASCNVKTLLTEHAEFWKSYLIRYHEKTLNGWWDVCVTPCCV